MGSGTLLILLPKRPMCIAAYLTLVDRSRYGDVSRDAPASMLEILFIALALLQVVRAWRHGRVEKSQR